MSRKVFILAGLLIVTGSVISYYRNDIAKVPFVTHEEQPLWNIEIRAELRPDPNLPVKAVLDVPENNGNYKIYDESLINSGYGFDFKDTNGDRKLHWTKRRSKGVNILYYRASIIKDSNEASEAEKPIPPPVPNYHPKYQETIFEFLDDVRDKSADIISFTTVLIHRLNNSERGKYLADTRLKNGDYQNRTALVVDLLKGAQIPSRLVLGFELNGNDDNYDVNNYLQVHDGDSWNTFDITKEKRVDQADLFVWSKDGAEILNVENAISSNYGISVVKQYISANDIQSKVVRPDSFFFWFDLNKLPLETQTVMAVLLLLPLCAVLVSVARIVIGIPTAGTFAPALLALAFRDTNILFGLSVSILVITAGLLLRMGLERLQLLFVPKLSIVLSVIIMMMLLISLFSYHNEISKGMHVAIFPMVVLAWIIERLSTEWEESGATDVIKQSVGTIIVAFFCVIMINNSLVNHIIFNFPEFMLVTIGVLVLLGRYEGYRLTELHRFRAFSAN